MSRHGTLAAIVLSVVGVALSVVGARMLYLHVTEKAVVEFRGQVDEAVLSLEREIDSNVEELGSLRSFFEAARPVSRAQFATFARWVLEQDHTSVQALEWIPRVPAAERRAFESASRREGYTDFEIREIDDGGALRRASARADYFPVAFVEPMQGNETAHGLDLASDATRRAALEAAHRDGTARATAALKLVQETAEEAGFLVFLPVFAAGGTLGAPAPLEGFVCGAYRVGDLVRAAPGVTRVVEEGIGFRVFDHSRDAGGRLLHAGGAEPKLGAERIEHLVDLDVAGRHWRVRATPGDRYLAARGSWEPYAVLAIGLFFTAGVAAYVRVAATRTRAVERLVEKRTQDLREANARLDRERGILQAVLDNLGDGVSVTDEHGRLMLFNPAAEEILGIGLLEVGPEQWSESYGLFHPDGRTPIAVEDLPLARAVAGGETADVEMFVRTPQKPGGTFIRVKATPLRDNEGTVRGGVAVFRDVSERKWAEAVLRDSAARFRAIVEAAASALIILSPEHRIREFNPQAEAIFGLGRAQALGQDFLELCLPTEYREAVRQDLRRALAGERTPGFETAAPTRTGAGRTLLWSFSRLSQGDEKDYVLIATGLDITERKQAEQSRRVRELAAHLQSAREAERTHVAREIHDELGQALTGLKLEMSFLARHAGRESPELAGRLERASGMIDSTINSVRRIAAELRPQILDELGLLEAIRWQAKEFERRTSIPCEVELPDAPIEWAADRATAMFRILQESLTNVARHADASRVSVQVTQRPDRVVLEVRDDGRGITSEEAAGSSSFGVLGMQERARMFGGELSIDPRGEGGTIVTASLPH